MKRLNALRWCATLTLSALILAGFGVTITSTGSASSLTTSEIRQNINKSPKPTKVRIIGASIFSISILTAIIVVSREIKSSKPKKERILSKYYRS